MNHPELVTPIYTDKSTSKTMVKNLLYRNNPRPCTCGSTVSVIDSNEKSYVSFGNPEITILETNIENHLDGHH